MYRRNEKEELSIIEDYKEFNGCMSTRDIATKIGVKYCVLIEILRTHNIKPVKSIRISFRYTKKYLYDLRRLYLQLKVTKNDIDMLDNVHIELKYIETLKLYR